MVSAWLSSDATVLVIARRSPRHKGLDEMSEPLPTNLIVLLDVGVKFQPGVF